jgi:hypothetical protein
MKEYKLRDIYTVAFVVILLLSNIIAGKIIKVGPLVVTGALFLFPLSYIFGDVLTEVYGYARNRRIIWLGFGANVLMALVFLMAVALPHPEFWKGQEHYRAVLGVVPRIVLASLAGYWCGSFVNAWIMARMKAWMVKWDPKHRFLFLRTIASTVCGEGVDSVLFVLVGFLGSMPFGVVLTMVAWQWIGKTAIEAVMTPVTYLVVRATKKAEGMDVVGSDTYSPFRLGVKE